MTDFPSATRFRLTLGADSPCADERCAGNLGLSATALFTLFIATHVSIRSSDTSSETFQSTFTGLPNALLPLQRSDVSWQWSVKTSLQALTQSLQHLGNLFVLVSPALPIVRVDIAKIQTVAQPHAHLISRP